MLCPSTTLWKDGTDSSVEVDSRALIDKVLARYSAEFTVFRELLQNSDDSESKAVEIRFETKAFVEGRNKNAGARGSSTKKSTLPDLESTVVDQWIFRNNGKLFEEPDWERLKQIAKGNPDAGKIGAFGVGFYSLFSVTEEPLVTSGGKWMGLYWKNIKGKKDQLFARCGKIPSAFDVESYKWTSFSVPLREPAPMPTVFDLTRFLATSLTFMVHISEVSLYFDDRMLARLIKITNGSIPVSVPGGLARTSPLRMMNVVSIKCTQVHLKAAVMRQVYHTRPEKSFSKQSFPTSKRDSFFGSGTEGGFVPQREGANMLDVVETSVDLKIFSAEVDTMVEQKMKSELIRCTKKDPPSKLVYDLIYTPKDAYNSQENQAFVDESVFKGLRADLDGIGLAKVFIGHATAQTTGIAGHMAARFIPTIERESVDLVDRYVAVWNRELLYVGGLLSRVVYEVELADVRDQWNVSTTEGARLRLRHQALHTMKFFTFHTSTPSSIVSSTLQDAFFSSGDSSVFTIISTAGVRNISEVRLPDQDQFGGFLKRQPVLPPEVMSEAETMVATLVNRGMIKPIMFEDVLTELHSRPLDELETVTCLKWWILKQGQAENGMEGELVLGRTKLLDAAKLATRNHDGSNARILRLATVEKFIDARVVDVPDDSPLAPHVLPLNVSKVVDQASRPRVLALDPASLAKVFLWTELSILDWLIYILRPLVVAVDVGHNLNISAPWAERVLNVLSYAWQNMSPTMRNEAVTLLQTKTCIPTTQGMTKPDQSYISSGRILSLFPHLPMVKLPSGDFVTSALNEVLEMLGVRKYVQLDILIDRLTKSRDWNMVDLARYLTYAQNTLELAQIQELSVFTEEGRPAWELRTSWYQINDLYEPLDIHRQLGLPLIDWPQQPWRDTSDEAVLLFKLGLRRFPPLDVIITLAASHIERVRNTALDYFLVNINTQYCNYHPDDFPSVPFIPALEGNVPCMGTPRQVYTCSEWASLGFLVIDPSLHGDALTKLKISEHPPPSSLVSSLSKTPPVDEAQAQKWFEILAGRISVFTKAELDQLSRIPFVPIMKEDPNEGYDATERVSPRECYLGGGSTNDLHSKLFVYVDFDHRANTFLRACGTKDEPSVEEIALFLVADPQRFYDQGSGMKSFLSELRNIAIHSHHLTISTVKKMKVGAILLGSRRKPGKGNYSQRNSDDDGLEYDLRRPDQIIIADDTNGYQLFGHSIFTAPQEDLLEELYIKLGSPRLSSLMVETYKKCKPVKNSLVATEIKELVLERLPLFLHEHNHSNLRDDRGWLNKPGNFIVKSFQELHVTKTLNFEGADQPPKQVASAIAERLEGGIIQLSLAEPVDSCVDKYEVATSLCRLLFEPPKLSDALLFHTILSTNLKVLERRGYNVARILEQPRDCWDATLMPKPSRTVSNKKSKWTWTNIMFRSPKFTTNTRQTTIHVWKSDIWKSIQEAIERCAPETRHRVPNKEHCRAMSDLTGYCDITGHSEDLDRLDMISDIPLFVSKDIVDRQGFIAGKHNILAHFASVIHSLGDVYGISRESIHAFYDLNGAMVAFNQNGSIFLNLKYFEERHYADVSHGDTADALISWYFTLAHEIAHNVHKPHDAQHELLFSSLCEKHLYGLGSLLPEPVPEADNDSSV